MAKWLALQTLDHKVLGLNPAGGGMLLKTVWHFIAQQVSISHFHNLIMT